MSHGQTSEVSNAMECQKISVMIAMRAALGIVKRRADDRNEPPHVGGYHFSDTLFLRRRLFRHVPIHLGKEFVQWFGFGHETARTACERLFQKTLIGSHPREDDHR